jgi:hypothetical protein
MRKNIVLRDFLCTYEYRENRIHHVDELTGIELFFYAESKRDRFFFKVEPIRVRLFP